VPPLFVLVGPTASGKTAVSIPLARALDAEIVSLDSMLVYRGMDVGTDKPRELGGVPHHLIDLLDPSERFDLRRYLAAADAAVAAIRARGRTPLVVGGTGLYLKALLKGLFDDAPRRPDLRERWREVPAPELHRRLREIDPASAARLHENDRRRIVRALEVLATTGRAIGELQTQFQGPDRYEAVIAGIRRARDDLWARIRARIAAMRAAGLVEEVRGLRLGPTASQAVGYKEILLALSGSIDMEEAWRRIERHTRRLVRRQETWFRKFPVHWVDAAPGETPETLVPRLLEIYRGSTTE
jgi:tRNA dimethylallyltransferase